jgi:uncharacterized membrane protein
MAETPDQTPQPASPRWIRIALAVSVALNLAVAGLALGAMLNDGPPRGMPRDLSFGPFTEAFSAEDRRALREAFRDRMPGFRASREAARAEFQALIEVLRTDPVDPAALNAALIAIETRNAERLELGRSLIEARLLQMSAADRRAYADRLERGLGGRHGG